MQKQHNGQGEWLLPSFKMLPLICAKMEDEAKHSLYLWGEVGRLDVAGNQSVETQKLKKNLMWHDDMASLLEMKPEEKQLELGGELGVGEQVVQGVEVPEEVGVETRLRQQLLGNLFFLIFTKFTLVLVGSLKLC